MTEQKFHLTGLDPRAALCGRSGHIWAGTHWPDDADMRAGRFVRCQDCDRLSTPALQAALDDARTLELAALSAFRTGWREGCGLPAGPNEPAPAGTCNAVRRCRDLGRRIGTEAASLVHKAAGQDPPSSTLDGGTTPAAQ